MRDESSDTTRVTTPKLPPHVSERGSCKQIGGRSQWSADEHERFLAGLARFGPQKFGTSEKGGRVSVGLGPGVADVIAVVVGTRTVSQVRSHAQKYFLRKTRKTLTADA